MKTIVSITPIAVQRDSRTFKQAASMARLGYRSIVVEAEPSRSLDGGLPFELVTLGGRPDPARAATSAPAPAQAAAGGDLYYLHSPLYFPAIWWRSRRTPFVYDAHDLYWEMRRDGRELTAAVRGIWAVWDVVERLCAARARCCVTVGDGVARYEHDRFGRDFVVVRNAHDARLDDSGVTGLRARLGLSETDFLLAVSGNFKHGRAAEPIMQAFSLLPDHAHLAFVGANYDGFAARERVHFVPPVPPTQIVPLLATADAAAVLYLPATAGHRYALPNGFFHAVAAGTPVLYPRDLPDLRELAERYRLGWEIDPADHDSIEAAVRTLVDDPGMLARCRAHLREVRDELSWANEERVLERVVAGALSGDRH
jgi:glycosyltransferase involved in cell wall biosynthesis